MTLSRIRFSRAFVCEGNFLLPRRERHYSEWRVKRTSIFQIPMPALTAWRGSPKGALMQTEVCVRQGFRFPAPRQGEFLPLDPDQPLGLGTISYDAVKHLLLCRIERRPPRLDLENYPHLPLARVHTTQAAEYMALLSEVNP